MNTLVFRLHAEGAPAGAAHALSEGEADAASAYTNVYASSLVWEPQGSQLEKLGARPAAPVHGDIVLAKLAPGQVIEFEAHAVKNIGKLHAKWSPVATAAYRMLPDIKILTAFEGAEAEALVAACPMGVFDIEDIGKGTQRAAVARPRDCTVCRECLRPPGWADRISVGRVLGHYIFTVESTGGLDSRSLVNEALGILANKARVLLAALDEGVAGLNVPAAGGQAGVAAAEKLARGIGGLPVMPLNVANARNIAAMKNPEDEED